jgi:hypothetical protein
MNIFGKKLAELGILKEQIRYCGGGQREYCYMGIKLRSEIRGEIKRPYVNASPDF